MVIADWATARQRPGRQHSHRLRVRIGLSRSRSLPGCLSGALPRLI